MDFGTGLIAASPIAILVCSNFAGFSVSVLLISIVTFAAGFGIAIVPKIPLLDTMDVCVRPIISPEIERYIYLVLKKEKYLTPVVKDFISFITDQSEFA